MPRYLVERNFRDGLSVNSDAAGAEACLGVISNNAEDGVTWVHSYVSDDRKRTWCIYDGPSPEAIRRAAERNRLPIESISVVRVLDPYFHFQEA